MIKLGRISIRNVRGIRLLDLNFEKENFGICGPNGTGKSGVVDAIEFVLTGDMTRLKRKGSSELNLSKHGPHVDAVDMSNSKVTVWGHLPEINKDVQIIRCLDRPNNPTIVPNTKDVKDAVMFMQTQPEFALSRREIVKYILTPPGERAKDVQTLLKLEDLNKIRSSLNTVANSASKGEKTAKAERDRALQDFLKDLGLNALDKDSVLEGLNTKRAVLGLENLLSLLPDTNFLEGNSSQDKGETKAKIAKAQALGFMDDFKITNEFEAHEQKKFREDIVSDLNNLNSDVTNFQRLRNHTLIEQGLSLISGDYCPLCEREWVQEDLFHFLNTKHAEGKALRQKIDALESKLARALAQIKLSKNAVSTLSGYAETLGLETDTPLFQATLASLTDKEALISEDVNSSEIVSKLVSVFNEPFIAAFPSAFAIVYDAVLALPEQSPEDTALAELVQLQLKYQNYQDRNSELNCAEHKAKIAVKVSTCYNEAHVATLDAIYETVSGDFTKFYRKLNAEDEANFTADFIPEPSKLTLNVDFYGRGKFPPGAFHSEGHQDGMGLCLYLALMKHTLGNKFRFCVLDDVLMSVDVSHRSEVCRLLKSEFPDTQFVVTTHDKIWVKYMRSQGLIKNSVSFFGWSVEQGPQIWDDLNVWEDIEQKLSNNDVNTGAFILRRYLEYAGHAFCDGLRAPVGFKGDGNYSLNDLFPPAIKRIKDMIKQSKSAASSWGKEDRVAELADIQNTLLECSQATNVEFWAVNPVVHYNEWANLDAAEFGKVVTAYRSLFHLISCSNCGGFLHLTYDASFSKDSMKCSCGTLQFDLIKKK